MWGIWCIRSPSSRLGYGASWARDSRHPTGHKVYETKAEAEAQAKAWNQQQVSRNVTYYAEEYDANR